MVSENSTKPMPHPHISWDHCEAYVFIEKHYPSSLTEGNAQTAGWSRTI
jgi:hypothetical protein